MNAATHALLGLVLTGWVGPVWANDRYGDLSKALDAARVSPAQAIDVAQKEVAGGKAIEVELEVHPDAAFYEVALPSGDALKEVKIDSVSGKVLGTETEQPEADDAEELAAAKKALAAAKLTFAQALELAIKEVKDGRAFKAELDMKGDRPVYQVVLLKNDKLVQATIDGFAGKVLNVAERSPKVESKQEQDDDDEEHAGSSTTAPASGAAWREEFKVDKANWVDHGSNAYFILEPGYRWHYKHGAETLTITILDDTKVVDGVTTRVLEEREQRDGKLLEVSRNFFAIDKATGDVYYFGEEVDDYKDGKLAGHGGAWLSGVNGARFGLMMPGTAKVGDHFYQEIAPKVAMDRAEIISLEEKLETPAGTFVKCLHLKETTPLERGASHKLYAPGVGLVKDDKFVLERVEKPTPKP